MYLCPREMLTLQSRLVRVDENNLLWHIRNAKVEIVNFMGSIQESSLLLQENLAAQMGQVYGDN